MDSPLKSVLLASIFASTAAATPFWVNGTAVTPCTTTISTIVKPQVASATTWPVVLTMTSHTVTDTAYTSINCGGCRRFKIMPTILGVARPEGRLPTSIEIYTAPEPTTVTMTHCVGFSKDAIPQPTKRAEALERVAVEDIAAVQGSSETGASQCTSTIFHAPRFSFGPVRTVHTTTSTTTRTVDCGNCSNVAWTVIPFGVPPVAFFNTTVTAAEPATATELECSRPTPERGISERPAEATPMPTASLPSFWAAPPSLPRTVFPVGVENPDCTRTIGLAPDLPDSTLTVFPSTVTHTSRRNCGTCELVWSTATVQYFARVSYVTTVWKKRPSIATALTCSRTRHVMEYE